MRFRIDIAVDAAAAPPSARLTLHLPGEPARTRDVALASDGQGGWFPVAPQPLAAADFQRLLRHFRARRTEGSETFGRYLFAVLLGDGWWDAIRGTTRPQGDNLIELALAWPPGGSSIAFDRLPWELLHDGTMPLVASISPRIAVTRVIPRPAADPPAADPGAADPRPSPAPLDLPPRVLFVIGAAPEDPRVRAAAEVLGLLRSLENPERTIHARVLQNASPARIQDAVKSFRPEVVHFICHGDTRDGKSWLELQPDDPGGAPECDAGIILDSLRPDGQPAPTIVVLSACRTAEPADTGDDPPVLSREQLEALPNQPVAMGSLGAQLVSGGVPIVIGMSGRVSDVAARLFTRRFEASVLEGQPLVAATADARRAPFLVGRVRQSSIDWAYPTILMDERVDPQYAPTPKVGAQGGASKQDEWLTSYRLTGEKNPVFCGRQDFFDAFDEMFRGKGRGVLAAYAQPQSGDRGLARYGKTRIIEQLTFRALREGHMPLVVSSPDRAAAPKTLLRLVEELRNAESFAVTHLGLPQPPYRLITELKRILDNPAKLPDVRTLVRDASTAAAAAEQKATSDLRERYRDRVDALNNLDGELDVEGRVTGRAVCLALRCDMWTLADGFRSVLASLRQERLDQNRPVPPWLDDPSRARGVVFFDDLDLYDGSFIAALFGKLTNKDGLGSKADAIPLVVTFSYDDGPGAQLLKPTIETPKPYANVLPLQAFRKGEDILCYQRVLLHPFDPNLFDYEGVSSGKALAVDGTAPVTNVQSSESYFRQLVKGRPANLTTDLLYAAAHEAMQKQYLVDADDTDVIRELQS